MAITVKNVFSKPPALRQKRRKQEVSSKLSVLDFVSLCLLSAVTVVTPWFFGGVLDQTQVFIWPVIILAFLIWWIQLAWQGISRVLFASLMIPVFIAPLWVMMQLVPLPSSITNLVMPRHTEIRQDYDKSKANITASKEFEAASTTTLCPPQTKRTLRNMFLCISCFFLATQIFRTRNMTLWFAAINMINGAALACFGILQAVSWNGKLFWTVELTGGGSPFASFVSRNNAGGFLLLCLACGLCICFWVYSRRDSNTRVRESTFDELSNPLEKLWFLTRWFFAELTGLKLAVVLLTVLIGIGVVASASRGTFVALAIATIVSGIAVTFAGAKRKAIPVLVLLLVVSFVGVIWGGFDKKIAKRFESVDSVAEIQSDNRISLWLDTIPMVQDFWITGSGVGTFRYLHRSYLSKNSKFVFVHAENQYIEALIEAGIIGLLLVIGSIALALLAARKIIKDKGSSRSLGVGVMGIFAVTATAVHNFFDFGLYAPANAILFASIVGTICASASIIGSPRRSIRGESKKKKSKKPSMHVRAAQRTIVICLAIFLIFFGTISAVGTYKSSLIERAMYATRFRNDPTTFEIEELDRGIQQLEKAARGIASEEATLRLARLYELRYRKQVMNDIVHQSDEELGLVRMRKIWQTTSIENLQSQINEIGSRPKMLEKFRRQPVIADNIEPAFKNYFRTVSYCPVMHKPYLKLTMLGVLYLDKVTQDHLLQTAVKLAPNDSHQMYFCGIHAAAFGKMEIAKACWRKCMEQNPEDVEKIIALCKPKMTPQEISFEMLSDDPELILRIAQSLYSGDDETERFRQFVAHAEQALDKNPHRIDSNTAQFLRGKLSLMKGDTQDALNTLKALVKKRPTQYEWRFEYAKALDAVGEHDQALIESKKCSVGSPRNKTFEDFVQQVMKKIKDNSDL